MVEVNSTFYEYPSTDLVRSWRRRTPSDFEFTVRCHRDLTHRYHMQPIEPAFQAYERMVKICEILRAEIMHIQTPPSLELAPSQVASMHEFLSSIATKKIRIAWEIRSKRHRPVAESALNLMKDHNIIHCTDISKGGEPAYTNDILYTRLFGTGEHNVYQYSDEELRETNGVAEKSKVKRVILNFHNVRQYKDAARLKVYRQTGRFPKITTSLGIQSLIDVLEEDASFPVTKSDLIRDQGWKMFDLREDERRRVSDAIEELPDRTYSNLQDLTYVLQRLSIG